MSTYFFGEPLIWTNILSLDLQSRAGYDAIVDEEPEEYSREGFPANFREEDYLTVAQAAERLGINAQSVRNAAVHGNLAATSLFGRVLITPAAVEEYRARTQPEGVKKVGRPRKS